MDAIVVTPCVFMNVMGRFSWVAENICSREVTFTRFQFSEELKAVNRNMPSRTVPGKNTGWVLGGADTCILVKPLKIHRVLVDEEPISPADDVDQPRFVSRSE